MTAAVEAPARPTSPFRGLTPYTEDDAALFFGRDEEVEVVIANLEARRLTLLYGESGVGKSSLLRAGVIHRLRETARRNRAEIGTPELVPVYFAAWRDDPLAALLETIGAAVSAFGGEAADEAPPSRRLDEALERWSAQADADILVVLDQFEEYFVYHALEHGEGTFAGELPRAVNDPRLRARFVVSIREDTLAKLDRFKREIPALFGTYLRVRHLDRDSARLAITRPTEEHNRAHGTDVEIEPELVGAVLDQVTAGRVVLEQAGLGAGGDTAAAAEERIEAPYLQLVMTRLWNEERERGSRLLRLATLQELGGAETIVRTHLDAALGAVPEETQDVVADVFHYLVTPTGTKVAYAAPDLAAYTGRPEQEVSSALEWLAGGEARILRPVAAPPGEEGPPRYEIFHDVLGPAVLDWRTRNVRRRLERERNRAEAQARAERRRARVYRALAVGAFALLIAGAVVLAVIQAGRIESARDSAQSRLLASESRDLVDGSLDTAILRAVEAGAHADTFEARSALLAAAQRSAGLRELMHLPSSATELAVDPARGTLAAVLAENGSLVLRDRDGRRVAARMPRGIAGRVTSAAFSPDGRRLAVAKGDSILFFDVSAEGRVELQAGRRTGLEAAETITGLAFSADGRWLAWRRTYGTSGLWDLRGAAGPETVRTFPGGAAFAFSPTAPDLVAIARQGGGMVLWNVRLGRSVGRPYEGSGLNPPSAVAFSPDGSNVAVGTYYDNRIRLWRVGGRAGYRTLDHAAPVTALAFGRDRRTLASGGDDGKVLLWDTALRRLRGEPLRGHNTSIASLAFDRQTGRLAVAALDGKASLWDTAERARLTTRTATARTHDFDVSGWCLVFTGRVRSNCVEWGDGSQVLALGPTGSWIGVLSFIYNNGFRIWDLRRNREVPRLPPEAPASADFRSIAFSSDDTIAVSGYDGRILLWRPGERKLIATFAQPQGQLMGTMAFSPDGALLAVGSSNASGSGSVAVWRVPQSAGPTPREPRRVATPVARMPGGHQRSVSAVALSPDGATLASGGLDNAIKLWDVREARLLDTLIGHTDTVTGLAFSADGATLASSSSDGTVQLWDAEERRRLGEPLEAGGALAGVRFGPVGGRADGEVLAAAVSGSPRGELDVWGRGVWALGTEDDVDRLRRRLCRVAGGDLSPGARAMQFSSTLREACGWS